MSQTKYLPGRAVDSIALDIGPGVVGQVKKWVE